MTDVMLRSFPPREELPRVSPAQASPDPSREALDRHSLTVMKVLLVGAVVLQRLQLPGGVPVTLVLLLIGAGTLWVMGAFVLSRNALMLFLASTGLLALCAWLSSRDGGQASLTSLLFLVLLYLPWVLRVRESMRGRVRKLGAFFVGLAGFFGAVAMAQLGLQFAHVWTFADYVGMLPREFRVPGYNPVAEFTYGSGIYRPQGFVFLEPSMLSQTSALGIIVSIALRQRPWTLIGPALGLIAALSGTGMFLLAVGGALILAFRPRSVRFSVIVVAVSAAAAVLFSPFADGLMGRSDEIGKTGSSGSLRFIDPYVQVLGGLADEPMRVLFGAGPGTSERLLATARGTGTGQAVVYTIPAKLLFEYGAVAGLLFLVFFLFSMLRPAGIPLLGPSMVFMLLFLSGALLQPNTGLLAWLLVVIWRGRAPSVGAARDADGGATWPLRSDLLRRQRGPFRRRV